MISLKKLPTIACLALLCIFAQISFAKEDVQSANAAKDKSKSSSQANKNARSAAKKLPTLIKFGKGKCAACVSMKHEIAKNKSKYSKSLKIVSYNISTPKGKAKYTEYNCSGLPVLIFLNAEGKEIYRRTGFMSLKSIAEKFTKLGVKVQLNSKATLAEDQSKQSIFETVEKYLQKHAAIAILAAFIWGILSVVISPCHLASIPLIVGFISSRENKTKSSAFLVSTVFAIGMFVSIVLIGGVIELLKLVNLGHLVTLNSEFITYLIAGLLILVGLNMLSIIPTPFAGKVQVKTKSKGVLTAFWLGLTLGVALGPCSLAFMAPILAVVAFGTGGEIILSLILLGVYAIGHCAVIAIAGGSTGIVQRYLNWNEKSHTAGIAKGICGVLVILSAIWIIAVTAF